MPDSDLPPGWRTKLRIERGVFYFLTASAGIAALLWGTPYSDILLYLWCSLTIMGGLGCFYGVVVDRYRVEWGWVWVLGGGLGAYLVQLWNFALTTPYTSTTQAILSTGLLLGVGYRGTELAAHAAKVRRRHLALKR